jgi:hypothetical protein
MSIVQSTAPSPTLMHELSPIQAFDPILIGEFIAFMPRPAHATAP